MRAWDESNEGVRCSVAGAIGSLEVYEVVTNADHAQNPLHSSNRKRGNMADRQWNYAKSGQSLGPVSGKQLKQLADSGQLVATDLVWTDGMSAWAAASKVPGLFGAATPPAFQQPSALLALDDVQPLWNPNAAANWSILFSPIFGAYIHAKNWERLGQPDKAASSMNWVVGCSILWGLNLIVFLATVNSKNGPKDFANYASFVALLWWYFGSAKHQTKVMKEKFPVGIFQDGVGESPSRSDPCR